MDGPPRKWGVCTTAKAPLPQILAFVAWHKHIGASRIWVHLDDADTVSAAVLNQLDGVSAIVCDDAYWAVKGDRPRRQEPRQSYNMQRVYGVAELPVIAHLDVDEYLYSTRPIDDILAGWPEGQPFIRAAPAEALHDPTLADDIFTARQFRLPFRKRHNASIQAAVLGKYAGLLPFNMLSHRAGKSFFRTDVNGFLPKIHVGQFIKDHVLPNVPPHPDVVVLHFHAQDKAAWLDALPHRTQNGAYRFNEPLANFLAEASTADIDAFYAATQSATPELVAALAEHGLLLEADLGLRDKIDALEF